MAPYKLTIFDMDGTLYKFDSGEGDDAIFKTRFYDEIKEKSIDFIMEKLATEKIDASAIREDIFSEFKGDISIGLEKRYGISTKEYFNKVWDVEAKKYMRRDQNLINFITNIPGTKALLTLAPEIWAKNALSELGITSLFDGMWFGDGNIRKPNPLAYQAIFDFFSVAPDETIYIEDEPKYLRPAKGLGITTILLGTQKEPWIDYTITDLFEIQNLLGGV